MTKKPTADELMRADAYSLSRLAGAGEMPGVDPDLADFMGAFEDPALDAEAAARGLKAVQDELKSHLPKPTRSRQQTRKAKKEPALIA